MVFHVYRHKQHQLGIVHLGVLTAILVCFYILDVVVHVPNVVIMGEMALFFAVYAKITT
ncbi:hypothetical protein D3C75_1342980 [compost metagenome]